MRALVTGAAGFIGFHTSMALLKAGHVVHGVDNLNGYYDPSLKAARLKLLGDFERFSFNQADLVDSSSLEVAWDTFAPTHVVHLAAQPGVRYSLDNPKVYIQANIVAFQNVIDLVRARKPVNFVYASSSSVYGGSSERPFRESQRVDSPVSLYAATKVANELVARTYSHLFQIPAIGLRFFTVYGPFGRPDMAMFKFADMMTRGEPLTVYNGGRMLRDFTYVDDIVAGVLASLARPKSGEIYNIGRGEPVDLGVMIDALERHLGMRARKVMMPMQAGDVEATWSDTTKARDELGYRPSVSIDEGVARFAKWYIDYHSTRT